MGQRCAGPQQGQAVAQGVGTLLGLMYTPPHALGASQIPLHPLWTRGLSQSQDLVPGWGDSCTSPDTLGRGGRLSPSSWEPPRSAETATLACRVVAETETGSPLQAHSPAPHPWESEGASGGVAVLSHGKGPPGSAPGSLP